MFSFWRDMVDFHDLVALKGFKMNIEPPQAMQVFEHFVSGVAQGFAVMLLVTQGQRAIAAAVDAPDLHVGFTIAQVVLSRQGFTNGAVAVLVMNGRY